MNKADRKNKSENIFAALGMNRPDIEAGVKVFSSKGELLGHTTGNGYRCRMSGCVGWRLSVKNLNGKTTFPCSKGMLRLRKGWKII